MLSALRPVCGTGTSSVSPKPLCRMGLTNRARECRTAGLVAARRDGRVTGADRDGQHLYALTRACNFGQCLRRRVVRACRYEPTGCRLRLSPLHGVDQRGRDPEVDPVLLRFPPPSTAANRYSPLRAVRRVLQEHGQQQQLQVRRHILQTPDRVVRVDDRAVVDRLAPVGRAEGLFAHRAPQQDGLAAGASLFGPPSRPAHARTPVGGGWGETAS